MSASAQEGKRILSCRFQSRVIHATAIEKRLASHWFMISTRLLTRFFPVTTLARTAAPTALGQYFLHHQHQRNHLEENNLILLP